MRKLCVKSWTVGQLEAKKMQNYKSEKLQLMNS